MRTIRSCIYAKDVARITGSSLRSARRLLHKVRLAFGKNNDQFVTSQEFEKITGIPDEIVREYIGD